VVYKNKPIIIDNEINNSDWIKSFSLDIPGVKDYESFERYFSIPKEEPEKSEALAFFKDMNWLDAVDKEIKLAVEKASKVVRHRGVSKERQSG
jgi:hypothetical protein